MTERALIYLTIGILLTRIISAAALTLGASWYDAFGLGRPKKAKLKTTKSKKSPKPFVSVMVYAVNSQKTIEQCLGSIKASGYKKLEIVIVDNASSDETKKFAQLFIANNKKVSIKRPPNRASSGTKKVC